MNVLWAPLPILLPPTWIYWVRATSAVFDAKPQTFRDGPGDAVSRKDRQGDCRAGRISVDIKHADMNKRFRFYGRVGDGLAPGPIALENIGACGAAAAREGKDRANRHIRIVDDRRPGVAVDQHRIIVERKECAQDHGFLIQKVSRSRRLSGFHGDVTAMFAGKGTAATHGGSLQSGRMTVQALKAYQSSSNHGAWSWCGTCLLTAQFARGGVLIAQHIAPWIKVMLV
ncbi:MAG: hypothetical protein WBC90_06345 [Albidovulum sp.]